MSTDNKSLVNEIIENEFIMEGRQFQYHFFQISQEEYKGLVSIVIHMDVQSGQALAEINGYLKTSERYRLGSGRQSMTIGAALLEKGENVLAYKGQLEILSITVQKEGGPQDQKTRKHIAPEDPYANALEFLLDSGIAQPSGSQFTGSNYCIYDYTNGCYRMPGWLWSDAPIVSALLETIKSGKYPRYQEAMEGRARAICDTFLRTQILDGQEESYGAYVSRYRYYAHADHSFHCLLGPNDTSFSIKWAMLPMYQYTGDERYLKSAEKGLAWVEKVIRSMDFVPSHYYFENKKWEDCAFVDTGFCVEGFQKYHEVTGRDCCRGLIDYAMDRFIGQFRLENGFYGQNYIPGRGVDTNLFSRGQGWAMEGMLACIREGVNQERYLAEALSLAKLMAENQNGNGSWSWSLGDGRPCEKRKQDTGECEKGTAVLAYLLLELYRLSGDGLCLDSAKKALSWCSGHIRTDVEEGYGGIASRSINSGITGLPFLTAATGYGNAFYLLAAGLLDA